MLVGLEVGEALVDLMHRPRHHVGADALFRTEGEHLLHFFTTARVGGRDAVHSETEREDVGRDGRTHAHEAQRTARAEEREELGKVDWLLRRERHQDEIERACDRVELRLVAVGDVCVRAERLCLLLLSHGARESGDIAAERARKLDCHVTQAAKAEDAVIALMNLRLDHKEINSKSIQAVLQFYTPFLNARFDDNLKRQRDINILTQNLLNAPSLDDFFTDIALSYGEQAEEPEGDALILSTIHSAKGKEWDSVYVIDVNEGSIPMSSSRDIEEERRLLYVAMTRAEDRLYICGWHTKNKAPEQCWYNLIEAGLDGKGEEIEDDYLAAAGETTSGAGSGKGGSSEPSSRQARRAKQAGEAAGASEARAQVSRGEQGGKRSEPAEQARRAAKHERAARRASVE